MHGRNIWLLALAQRPASTTDSDAARMAGVRNLFSPSRDQRFAAGDLVARARGGEEKPLRSLLAKLAVRIDRGEPWADDLLPVDPNRKANENPNIPSGYTYLLQLMAHDLIDSEVSLAEAGPGRSGFANTRVAPLALDTIYGGGPDNNPSIYEYDRLVRGFPESVPRTRLRLGRIARADGTTAGCPMRDLARAVPIDAGDAGLGPGDLLDTATLDAPRCPGDGQRPLRPWRTEALVADVRNDSHALISQLTVLFHVLHNHVLGLLGPPVADAVLAYRRYLCARLTVTMIYRSIIVRDVLRRLLDPMVYARYTAPGASLLEKDGESDNFLDLPLEFSHGAFRFGHAMTRGEYRVNSTEPQEFLHALEQSSVHGPNVVPVRELWHVDWSLFFETGAQSPNLSVRIGPNAAAPLRHSGFFPAMVPGIDSTGVVNRDLVSAAYADIWSVPHLIAHLRTIPDMAGIIPAFDVWKQPLSAWLGRYAGSFTSSEAAILAADPPLPFFILLEASYVMDGHSPKIEGGGQRLGRLGSTIVAETICGALRRSPVGHESADKTLRENIAAACGDLLGNAAALDAVPEIADMPGLLQFLRDQNAVNLPGRA